MLHFSHVHFQNFSFYVATNILDKQKSQPRLVALIGVITVKKWCRDVESNHGHRDFQSLALPTELSRLNSAHLYKKVFEKSTEITY